MECLKRDAGKAAIRRRSYGQIKFVLKRRKEKKDREMPENLCRAIEAKKLADENKTALEKETLELKISRRIESLLTRTRDSTKIMYIMALGLVPKYDAEITE